ncbi:hypothetical protein [Leucobacter sp. GX24907]
MTIEATGTRHRSRAILVTVFALVVALVASLVPGTHGVLGIPEAPAHAATKGHYIDFNGLIVGNFLSSDGRTYVYCIEPGADEPVSNQTAPVRTDTLPGYRNDDGEPWTNWTGSVWDGPVRGEAVRQMNYVMWVHGRTTNAEQAAVVQFAVWTLRRGPGTSAWLDHHIAWLRQHGHGAIIDRANALVEEAKREAVVTPIEPGPLEIESSYTADDSGRTAATGSVDYPAWTSELQIDGGSFDSGGVSHRVTNEQAGRVSWSADLHPENWQRFADVSISAEWSRETVSWPAEIMLHPPIQTSEQTLGLGISPVVERHERSLDAVEARFDTRFSPVLSTEVPARFVPRGAAFRDRVDIQVAEDATPWASRVGADGKVEFAPIIADGVLYGPFVAPPGEADLPPAGAPVTARARIDASDGPGSYSVSTSERADESGYYSWVWTIREPDQHPEVRSAGLIEPGYEFADRFGLVQEGQVVPTRLRWNTELLDHEVFLDNMTLVDRVSVSLHDGAWLRDESGDRVPATLKLTVFGSDQKPQRSAEVPEDAVEVAETTVTVSAPHETVESAPIALPFETRGWVTVRTCLVAEDQPESARGLVEEWCDDFGIPSETARIRPPEVTTQAQPEGTVGKTIRDTALVTERVPADSTLGFSFYLRPEVGEFKYDESWRPVRDGKGKRIRWTAEEIAALDQQELCLAQPVATTARIDVPKAGEYQSPKVRARSAGTGFWVEDLTTRHPDTGETVELHRGRCGIANERTVVTASEQAPRPAAERATELGLPETGGSGFPVALVLVPVLLGAAFVGLSRLRGTRTTRERTEL